MKKRGTSSKRGTGTRNGSRAAGAFPPVDEFNRAISKAAREAVLRHKRLGQSVFAWRNGRVVEIPAREIRVPPER